MKKGYWVGLALLMFVPAVGNAQFSGSLSGLCEGGQPVSAAFTIEFTHTGGDFSLGTATADVKFTLENTSGLYPFQVPAMGNPVLTSFMFNVPPFASVALTEARILAGSQLVSTGTTMLGIPIPAGCIPVGSDLVQTDWYELQEGAATGQYGIFTTSFETLEGIKAGLVDPEVYLACIAQGDVFSPLFIAGQVCFTVALGNLDESLMSAEDFLGFCSNPAGDNNPFSFAGKFQGTNIDGEDSCFIGEPGDCQPVPVFDKTWGGVKTLYR